MKSKILGALALSLSLVLPATAKEIKLLNVSYDPTREFYVDYNKAFANYWKSKTGDDVVVQQSHGGAGKQARAVIDGLQADVVTLALPFDIDQIAEKGRSLPKNWQSRLPNGSAPYTSTIVFLVKKGNPKGVRNWNDLARPGIKVITPNPKTSGGARYNYLAAWAFELRRNGGNNDKAREFVRAIFKNVPVLDAGARGSTTTFLQRGIGDVLITWENEALLAVRELGKGKFDIVYPSESILAEPPVTVVDKFANKKGNGVVATEYLRYLYSDVGQDLAGKHFYRPRNQAIAKKYAFQFPRITLFTVQQVFGSWAKAQQTHFSDGGEFDKIYAR
jgi:sulfate/thiosulfate-binding protein